MASSIADQSLVGFSWEKRPLKRPRLGPPDVYPQDPKQREDELTTVHVKQGFSHMPQISDEFGTAKNCNITAAKLGAFINGTISKKIELNALPDTGRKRLQVNTKDNFWPVTPRSKHAADAWMKDLAGSKPLAALGKRVPIFNKKEEIFSTLVEFSVPMLRASWFLKMTASYNSAISEAKTKKRQLPDPSQEWTSALLKYMKEILLRLSDWYAGGTGILPSSLSASSSGSGSATSTSLTGPGQTGAGLNPPSSAAAASLSTTSAVVEDGSVSLKQWIYCSDLAKQMFSEGLLDRFEWLQWLIDASEKPKTLDDSSWQALVPLLLSFIPDIAKSEYLARRLAHIAARRLSVLFIDLDTSSPLPPQPPAALLEYLQCPTHKGTVFTLVAALQVVTVECPTAMVWNSIPIRSESPTSSNSISENTKASVPPGSPLDLIPVPPSALPMPQRANNSIVREQLRAAEELIMQRSQAVEARWACEEWQESTEAATLQKVLNALDALDRHFFDKADVNNSIETMYAKIFSGIPICKENPAETDAPIVLLLCQWAVGPHRCGEHRAIAVARLLELRQSEVTSYNETDADVLGIDPSRNTNEQIIKHEAQDFANPSSNEFGHLNGGGEGNGNNTSTKDGDDESEGYCGLPIYHNLLFNYLDNDAPTLDESSPTSRTTFASLVHLFSALIRHDIFSHDTYLCTLVARGDLSTFPPANNTQANSSVTPIQQIQSVATPGPLSHPGPGTPASVSSVTPGTTPHHDNVNEDNRGPLFPPLPRIPDFSLGTKGEPGFSGLDSAKRHGDVDDRSSENIDDDLDRILQDITQEQQNNMNQIDSPKEESGAGSSFGSISNNAGGTPRANGPTSSSPTAMNPEFPKQNRHRLYVTHFPLPQDESCTHEANQRHILLYGVGRSRDETRHFVKKVFKDLGKLFSKKFCYDVTDGSRVKKQSKNEVSLENLQTRFQALPYFDQHAVTSLVSSTALEILVSFAAGRGSYLPTVENVAFLTELMELALNINGLVEACVHMLRELYDIESQLCQRGSSIMGQYTTSLQLHLVAVLRRYHNCLLLETELSVAAWESLIKLMKRVTNPSDWTSAERCSLAYIVELQSSCGFLPGKSLNDLLSPLALKLKQNLATTIYPSSTCYEWNNQFMTQCLDNPRRKVEPSIIRQLVDNPVCRYSFVSNAVLSICNEADAERVNDLASLCAEMTAAAPQLAAEWLGVFQSLCCPAHHDTSYAEILSDVDVKHLSIHSNLATLNCMLIARQCFSLQDQIVVQAVPSLLKAWQAEKAWNDGRGPNDTDIEAGARLTCHLLLSLFKTQDHLNSTTPAVLKLSCDRRQLSAAHNNITLGAVLAVLKAMLVLADAAAANERRREQRTISGIPQGELSISHILGTSDAPSDRSDVVRGEPRTLASFAINALHQMCAEPWLRQRCLQNPDELCNDDILLDRILSPKQAQRLLHMICYPEAVLDDCLDARVHIPRVLDNLNQWNLREALLTLSLQNKQLVASPGEHQGWLDIVARAALEVFHLAEEPGQEYALPLAVPSPAPGKSPRSGKKPQDQNIKTPPSGLGYTNRGTVSPPNLENKSRKQLNCASAWLIAPVIAKLPSSVQGRVLRHAGNVLESTLWPKNPPGPDTQPGLHGHLPFLALILTCLKGQDDQRETLLQSLLTQFTQLLQHAKDADSEGKAQVLRDALRLRLTLVGAMFEVVQRSPQTTAEWAVVLTQLVTHLVVDLNTNNDVFLTIVDMVTCLVHSTQITESNERVEETRKQNLNLIKKLKKELSDRTSPSVVPLRQLLPFSKVQVEVIVTQPTSTIVDSKGNRVQSFEFVDKKPGLQVWEKQRVSPWELIEGQRNIAPLSWSWFGAVKMDRKPLRYEEAHRLNKFHTHNLVKPFSHFLEPVPLPMEEMDMKPELHIKEELMLKPDTPMSDQSPRGAIAKPPKPKAPRKKRLTKAQLQQQQAAAAQAAAAAAAAQQASASVNQPPPPAIPNPVQVSQYNAPPNQIPPGTKPPPPSYGQRPGPPPQWYDGQQQPPPQQQPFFPQHQAQATGTRQNQSSKAALHQMLRGRNPAAPPGGTNQFQQFPQAPAPGPGPRQQILRQQLRAAASQPGQTSMQSQNFSGPPPNQTTMFQGQMQNQNMGQNYNFNQQNINMPNQGSGGSMMTPQPPNVGQMGPRGQVGDMSFTGQPGAGARPTQPRQGAPFIQGQPGMGGPMPGYPRPMAQMTRPGQPNQMAQMNQGQQAMQNPGQMQPGQMQMGMQGQMSQAGMGPNNPQRFRQMGMQQQQQLQQLQQQQQHMQQQPGMGNMGMRGPNPMHYNQNQQPGPY